MDQWLKTGAVKNIKRKPKSDQLGSTSQDTSKVLVQKQQRCILQVGKKREYCDEYMNTWNCIYRR